jgi:hypothetical protein
MRKIMERVKAGNFLRLLALASIAFFAATLLFAPADAAQVAVTVEKLTASGGGFIVEPTLVTLNGSVEPLSVVTLRVLDAKFQGGKGTAYDYTGTTTSGFYLSKVYDPYSGGFLGEFDEGTNFSGWMVTLNNSFIKASAASFSLVNRNVVRWQFTKNYGKDIGTDVETLGASTKPSKDDLIWKVALINGAGNKSAYGGAYTTAVNVLADLGATKDQISNALAALNAVNPDGGDNNNNDGGDINPGGSGDPDDDDSPGGDINPDDDDNPGVGGGTASEVQKAPVVTPAPGSGIMAGETQPLSVAMANGFGFENLVTETTYGVAVKADAFEDGLADNLKTSVNTITPLDMTDTKVPDNTTIALFSLKTPLDKYAGKALSSIAVLKMKRDKSVGVLTMASTVEDLASGSYVWTDKDGKQKKGDEKAAIGKEYYLSVAIKDNDIDYDLDQEAGKVVDPLALAIADTKDNVNDGNETNGGGGGCDAGAAGILALSLTALASATARRRGR